MVRTKANALILMEIMLFASAAAALDFKAICAIDRSKVFPKVPYQELTLRLPIGDATSAEVLVDGKPVVSRIDQAKKMLIVTTSGASVEAHVHGASSQSQIGIFNKAVLHDDKKWAWSHAYDDNVQYSLYGTEVFNQYGWAGTLFMIGNKITNDSNSGWICMAPDIRRLHKQGWAIGNHGWNHATCETCPPETLLNEIVQCQNKIKEVLATTDPTYKPSAFATPAFSHSYDAVVKNIRNTRPDIGILWPEGQGENANSCWRLDSGAIEPPWRWVWTADSNKTVPRATAMYEWGVNSDATNEFKFTIDSMVRFSDETHHYWFNSLDHGVDWVITQAPPQCADMATCGLGVFGFVPWLYKTHGQGGDNTVWVAPSEQVYSYYITELTARLSTTIVSAGTNAIMKLPIIEGADKIRPAMARGVLMKQRIDAGIELYSVKGERISVNTPRGMGLYFVKH
jgi:peptidoglycan/xylan/chitin deacetylase (PgdA/CDA1 family)